MHSGEFEAAGRSIADYEATLDAGVELWEAVTELSDAQGQVHDAAGLAQEAGREEVGAEVLIELAKALRVGVDLVGRDVSSRELLRSVQEASAALARFQEAGRQSTVTLHRLMVRVAQLNLLFAGKDAEVVEAARQVTESLVLIAGRVLRMGMESVEE